MNSKVGLITRCRNEPYVNEFVNHYLNEEIDEIYIIDDQSKEGLYKTVSKNPKVRIVTDIPFSNPGMVNTLYRRIRADFDWMIIVDMDEYITTKRNADHSIKQELLTTFKDVDCIKIPWVMMAYNGIEQNPKCLLETNVHRWNHDRKHEHDSGQGKLRCRHEAIEVKCAFRTDKFDSTGLHAPKRDDLDKIRIVDGVYNKPAVLDCFYQNFREKDIIHSYLLCFHYRVVSKKQCAEKLLENHLESYRRLTENDLATFDYPEVIDNTLCLKSQQRPRLFAE